jgi:tetratricopeptide (TPR) repeat protein
MAALAGEEPNGVDAALGRLCEAHLLDRCGPDRYALHDLLRVYARELAFAREPHPRASVAELLRFYQRHVDAAARLVYPNAALLADELAEDTFGSRGAALAWLDAEAPAIVAAIRDRAGSSEQICRLADGLRGYFSLRSRWVDWGATARVALFAAIAAGDPRARIAAHLSLAGAARGAGDARRAAAHYRTVLGLAAAIDWPAAIPEALNGLGCVALDRLDPDDATDYLQRAQALARAAGDRLTAAGALVNLGRSDRLRGRLYRSANQLARAVVEARQLDSPDLLAGALHNLAVTDEFRGETARAMVSLTEARDLFAAAGHIARTSLAEAKLAWLKALAGQPEAGLRMANRARTALNALGRREDEAYALISIGRIETMLGRYEDAERNLNDALGLAGETESANAHAHAELALVQLYRLTGRPELAILLAESVLGEARGGGRRIIEGQALTMLAEVYLLTGDRARATEFARTARANHRLTGHRPGTVRAEAVLGALAPPEMSR